MAEDARLRAEQCPGCDAAAAILLLERRHPNGVRARLRDPNNAASRYFLGAVLADKGRKAEAREELEGALRGGLNTAYAKGAEDLLKTLR